MKLSSVKNEGVQSVSPHKNLATPLAFSMKATICP